METILSPHSLSPLFNLKPSSPRTLLFSLQPKSNSLSLTKPITSSLKKHQLQSLKPSLPIPTSWFSYAQQGLAALALTLALNFSPLLPSGDALASEFDVLNEGPPKETYVIDDAGVLSRVTRSDLKRLLSDLESRKNFHINFITVRKLTSKADAFEYADQVLERWYPSVEEGNDKGIVVLVTSQKEGAVTGGPAFVQAVGESILDATVSENLPVLATEEKYNEAVYSSAKRLVAAIDGLPDPGGPTFKDNKRESNFKTKEETEEKVAFLSKAKALKSNSNFFTLLRCMSNVPENTVYGGPKNQNPNQRVTLTHLRQKHRKAQPITVVTAYDYPSAVHLDTAGIDVCLVGDSASMVVHGHDTTLPISLDEMLVHCRAVARGAQRPLLVGDLPFGTYESSTSQAVDTAVRVLKEGGMDAIKLEGGAPSRISAAKAIVEAGIAVMGHVGLTPQAISVLGGFRPQGKNVASAVKVVETAMALQEAGCFSVVLECVPPPVAAAVTSALRIPTIGIGAGPFCSGQVLVYHDLLGMLQHPHHAKVTPKFCKQFACVGDVINKALLEYREEVTNGSFPGPVHSPYKIGGSDVKDFLNELQKLGLEKAASAAAEAAEKTSKAESPGGGSPASD